MSSELKRAEARKYRKRRRAELEHRTRQRIAEAAMRLHGSVGPARTTISAVADEAGVQRATVYRHFANEELLFEACTAHFYELHPRPDPGTWAEISDPDERLTAALRDLYAWFGETEWMFSKTQRDIEHIPRPAVERLVAYFATVVETVMRGRPERGRSRRRVAAAIGHAINFQTWFSLVRTQGLDEAEARELMTRMVAEAGR